MELCPISELFLRPAAFAPMFGDILAKPPPDFHGPMRPAVMTIDLQPMSLILDWTSTWFGATPHVSLDKTGKQMAVAGSLDGRGDEAIERTPPLSLGTVTSCYFIKLGRGGQWEDESLEQGLITFGYRETPHESCLDSNWEDVFADCKQRRGDAGAARRDTNQIRIFYEATEETLFVTFAHGKMFWCRPSGPITRLVDGNKSRGTADGWHDADLEGRVLTTNRLSGRLLKVQGYRGTICQIEAVEYLLRKIRGEFSPEVEIADTAEKALKNALVGLIRLLTWQDFELLVDLIFSTSGWRRLGAVGRTQKTVDLELMLPTTEQQAFVQVKSRADAAAFQKYAEAFQSRPETDRMFFVWHSGDIGSVDTEMAGITLLGPQRLAQMVIDAGLTGWLREKVS